MKVLLIAQSVLVVSQLSKHFSRRVELMQSAEH